MSYQEKGVVRRGYVTYDYRCPGCKTRGTMDVIRDHEGPLACPANCGTMIYQSNNPKTGLPEMQVVKAKSRKTPARPHPKELIRRDVTTRATPVVRGKR